MKKIYTAALALLAGALCSFNVSAQDSAVLNETTGVGYDDLQSAINAVEDNDVLVVNQDLTIGSRINFNDKIVTVKGATGSETLSRQKDGYMLFLLGSGTTTLENLIIDGNNIATTKDDFEASHGGVLNINNVTFQNCDHSAAVTRIINIKNSSGYATVNLTDVKMVNCPMVEGNGQIWIQNNGAAHLNIAGNNVISVQFDGTKRIDSATNLTNTTPIDIYVADNRAFGNALVLGTTDHTKFRIANNVNGCVYRKASGNELQYFESNVALENAQTGYYLFDDARNAAQNEETIIVKKDVTTEGGMDISDGRTITVKALEGTTPTVTLTKNNRVFLSKGKSNLIVEGLALTSININRANAYFLAEEAGSTLTLRNVNISNYKSTHIQGIVASKNNAILNLENVTITECEVPEGYGEVFAGSKNTRISGNNSFNVFMEKAISIEASDLTNELPIGLYFEPANRADAPTLVTGGGDASKFVCKMEGYFIDGGENSSVYFGLIAKPGIAFTETSYAISTGNAVIPSITPEGFDGEVSFEVYKNDVLSETAEAYINEDGELTIAIDAPGTYTLKAISAESFKYLADECETTLHVFGKSTLAPTNGVQVEYEDVIHVDENGEAKFTISGYGEVDGYILYYTIEKAPAKEESVAMFAAPSKDEADYQQYNGEEITLNDGDKLHYYTTTADGAHESEIHTISAYETIPTGIDAVTADAETFVNVYTMQGVLVRANVNAAEAAEGLTTGMYIIGAKKVLVK